MPGISEHVPVEEDIMMGGRNEVCVVRMCPSAQLSLFWGAEVCEFFEMTKHQGELAVPGMISFSENEA